MAPRATTVTHAPRARRATPAPAWPHRQVLRVAADGTVSTVAGTGAAGSNNGAAPVDGVTSGALTVCSKAA